MSHEDTLAGMERMEERVEVLEAKLAKAIEVIEDLYMNTSTSMPPHYNDEASWYRSQLHRVIGRAARAHKEITEWFGKQPGFLFLFLWAGF